MDPFLRACQAEGDYRLSMDKRTLWRQAQPGSGQLLGLGRSEVGQRKADEGDAHGSLTHPAGVCISAQQHQDARTTSLVSAFDITGPGWWLPWGTCIQLSL